jgi:hypothetical protein
MKKVQNVLGHVERNRPIGISDRLCAAYTAVAFLEHEIRAITSREDLAKFITDGSRGTK